MLILFDQGTPRGIARALVGHTVKEARLQVGTHSRALNLDSSMYFVSFRHSYQILTRSAGGKYSFSPSFTWNAGYHASMLRTVSVRYSDGACGSVITCCRKEPSRGLFARVCPYARKNCWSPLKPACSGGVLPASAA